MKQLSSKLKTRLKIVGATFTAIFSLASAFVGTYAWFASNGTAEATGMSVSVKAEEGIQFNLYYLDYFAVSQSTVKDKDGNYDSVIETYAGYEIATANAVFKPVNYDSNGNVLNDQDHNSNPMNITHLWPNHKLTYAIVITGGNFGGFNLDTWGEVKNPNVLTQVNGQDVQVSLSWAIDIFGGAYYVTSSNSITDDITTGFSSYLTDLAHETLVDKFTFNQTSTITYDSLNIVNSISGTSGENKRAILYFSVEFSDDPSTFYSYSNPYYVKDTLGNSNCYESLSLTNLSFKLLQEKRQ